MPLFTRLAGRPANPNPSLTISWEFVDCSPYINTTIKMLGTFKAGGSGSKTVTPHLQCLCFLP